MSAGLRDVRLLGATRVDGVPVPGGRLELLLAIVVLRGAAGIRRRELTELLWPDRSFEDRGAVLDPLLSRLRRLLGPVEGRGLVRLATDTALTVDVLTACADLDRALDEELRSAAAAQALALDVGEALTAEVLGAHTDPWSQAQRDRLADRRQEALALAVRTGLVLGTGTSLRLARTAASALVAEGPLQEAAGELLMAVLLAQGDRAAALAVYEELRRRLDEELGVAPGAGLRERHARLLRGQGVTRTDLPLPSTILRSRPLAGRREELAALVESTGSGGPPRLLLVEGPPGIGKTRLVAELAADRHDKGWLVIAGRCREAASPPFAPVADALRPLAAGLDPAALRDAVGPLTADLASLLPGLISRVNGDEPPRTDPDTGRLRRFEAVSALLRAAAHGRGVLLVLDDLQWLDESTGQLLAHVLGPDGPPGVTVAATARRPRPSGRDPVAALRPDRALQLQSLEIDALAELVVAVRPDADALRVAADLHERTGGSPLLALALLAGPDSASGDLAAAVEDALAWAGPEVTELVQMLACGGGRAGLDVLAEACAITPLDLAGRADRALAAGLLLAEANGGPPGRLHDAVRETVIVRLGSNRRAALHLALAHESIHREAPDLVAVELARHWAAAGESARAAHHGERAARRALDALAFEDAAAHARHAFEAHGAAGGDAARATELLLLEADARNRGSALVAARAVVGEALVLARRAGRADLVARAAIEHGGHRLAVALVDDGLVAALQEGLEAADPDDHVLRARLTGRLASAVGSASADRNRLSAEAVDLARSGGDPGALAETLLWRHGVVVHEGRPDERELLLTEATSLARAAGRVELGLHARMLRLSDRLEAGELAAARREAATWRAEAEAALVPYHRWAAAVCLPTLSLLDGDLAAARACLAEAERLGVVLGDDPVVVSATSAMHLSIALADDQYEACADRVRAVIAQYAGVPVWDAVLAYCDAAIGDPDAARERVERVVATGFAGVVDANRLSLLSFLTHAAVLAGASAPALEALDAALAPHSDLWAVQHYGSAVHGPVAVRRAWLAAALGRPAQAREHLARADAGLGGAPPAVLRADRDLGEVRVLRAEGELAAAERVGAAAVRRASNAGLPGAARLIARATH